jgi:hypothetical protein
VGVQGVARVAHSGSGASLEASGWQQLPAEPDQLCIETRRREAWPGLPSCCWGHTDTRGVVSIDMFRVTKL